MRKHQVSIVLRRRVAQRAHGCCEYCRSQERFALQAFSAEHIEPRSQGGATTLDNLAWACQGCNNHKYNRMSARDPVTGKMARLFQPRKQRWEDHLAWNEDCTMVLGLTPTGRATVRALQLNRKGVVNLRRLLFAVQLHPPAESARQ